MITFLINRARRNWQVLSIVLLGVLVSTTILASGPLIVNSVMDFALRNKLRSSQDVNGTILIKYKDRIDLFTLNRIDSQIKNIITSNLADLSQVVRTVESPWSYPWQENELIRDERVNFIAYEGLEERIIFVSGGWQSDVVTEPEVMRVFAFKPMADLYKLKVGDQIPLSARTSEEEPSIWIEITGIIEPVDARDPYWLINDHQSQSKEDLRYISQFSVVIPEENLFELAKDGFSNTSLQFYWLAHLDPENITSDDIGELIASIATIKDEISSIERRLIIETNIDGFLANFDSQAASVRPPLYLLVGEVLFLGLYYVVMVAALSVRQSESEFATLSSRGASLSQLFQMQLFDALLLCLIALIGGPLLAYVLVWSLSIIGPVADVSSADWIASFPNASWYAAGVSIIASFTALIVPVIPAVKKSIVVQRRSVTRRTNKPWWQRFYIDVFLLVFGIIALWRLSLYGSISGTGSNTIDWILLFAPLALLIGSATILLRLFPTFFSILAKISTYGRGLVTQLALWQTSRDPTHVTRLVLLFTLAMALGVLSTGLNATLEKSESERARHSSGGEIRLASDWFIPLSDVDDVAGVTASSAVWRGKGRVNMSSYRSMPEFDLLAVEPFSFATVSQYRTDYTDEYVGYVLGRLIVDAERLPITTIPLPDHPRRFGLWLADPFPRRTSIDILESISVRTKFQSSQGEIFFENLVLTPVSDRFKLQTRLISNKEGESHAEKPHWRYFEGDIPLLSSDEYPISLHSLWIKIKPAQTISGNTVISQGPFVIDNISITNTQGEYKIVEGFEELSTIWQTGDPQTIASYTKHEITHTGNASMRLFFSAPGSTQWLVLSPAVAIRKDPIPVLASPVFLEMTELDIGDKFIVNTKGLGLLFEIKETVNYFPTMYETVDRGFLIVSREPLLAELNKASRNPVNANETWLNVLETQDIPAMMSNFSQAEKAWDVESERALFKTDPLTMGLRSVIFLAYSFTLLLSLVGFASYFYMSARRRSSIYGILRSLGLSSRQLYSSLVIEHLILIFAGLTIGVFLGTQLNKIVLPGLPISFGEIPPVPPFIPYEDWNAILSLVIILVTSFIITLMIGTMLLWRTQLHRVLRIGEE